MSNVRPIELNTLPQRHPLVGDALFQAFAPSVIVRLCLDPTPQSPGTIERRVEVDWLRRPGNVAATQGHRDIRWNGLPQGFLLRCSQYPLILNEHTLTEHAAIGVMALLVHELEGAELQSVLPIGSGSDYLVRVPGASTYIQLEVSGIRLDVGGNLSTTRLHQKSAQVLTHARVGFASVTTFSHLAGAARSWLHYVKRPRNQQNAVKPKKTKGKKK